MTKLKIVLGSLVFALVAASLLAAPANAAKPDAIPTVASIHDPHLDFSRDAAKLAGSSGSNLTYHTGPVMTTAVRVQPIFWGVNWSTPSVLSDKTTGIREFYSQYSGSNYSAIQTQYWQSDGSKVTGTTTVAPEIIDSATVASKVTSSVLAEVINKVGYSNLSTTAFYPVYTDLARGSAGYCAWHSYASVTDGVTTKVIKFGFFFNLDSDPGCTAAIAANPYKTGTQSLVNVSAHELAETLTDPTQGGWYDNRGYENGDKCAWKFNSNGVTLVPGSTTWQLQGEWNNNSSSCSW